MTTTMLSRCVTSAFLFTVALPLLAAKPAGSFSPLHATLVVPDAKTLPGVPFEMWVTVENHSDASVGFGPCPTLIVKPDTGTQFEITAKGACYRPTETELEAKPYDGAGPYLVLEPGQSKLFPFTLDRSPFFADERLSSPGTYRLSLRFDFCWGAASPQDGLLPASFFGPVTSNEVVFQRMTPSGSDAKVWNLLQTVAKGKWAPSPRRMIEPWRVSIWSDVLTQYPDSRYVPYGVLFADMPVPQRRKLAEQAIERFPDSPVIELLHAFAWRATGDEKELAILQRSKRPTTRSVVFPQEFEPK